MVTDLSDSKRSLLLLLTSPPNSERVAYGLELASRSSREGKKVTIVLMQDSVFLALKSSPLSQGFDKLSGLYALDEHLKRRGFAAESLGPLVKTIDYDGLVDLMMHEQMSVIGSF